MGKDSGRGNERLDAKAKAVYQVAEGEGGGSKIPPETPACVSLSKSHESKNRSLNKEILHVVIHPFIMHLTFHKKGCVTRAFWNSAART